MVPAKSTFIWEGRVHLGDEPGIYGNANYTGLSIKFPVTVINFNSIKTPGADIISFDLGTEGVNSFPGYLGHLIVIRQYIPDPQPTNPYKWKETVIKNSDRILNAATTTVSNVPVNGSTNPIYLSIAIEIDSDVKPGLYDDFLFTDLSYTTANNNVYVLFGFRDKF